MIHIFLLIICILSVEIFIRLNFFSHMELIYKFVKKVTYIIPKNNISDNWKEKIIPLYSLKIMRHSLQILFIISLVFILFLVVDFFINDFFTHTISLFGIIESIVFAIGYLYFRKSLIENE